MKITLTPRVICEVGTGGLRVCKASHYIGDNDVKVMLFDPITEYCNEINMFCQAKGATNTEINNCCLYDYDGKVDIYENGEASMIKEIDGPNIKSDYILDDKASNGFNRLVQKDCFRMSKFDKGNIDVLFLDTEGSEWFVLKHLISRPTIITIEMKMGEYINPYLKEIQQWMQINNYVVIKDAGCDLVFCKRNLAILIEDNRYLLDLKLKTFGF